MRSIQFHYFLFSFNEKLPRLRITMVFQPIYNRRNFSGKSSPNKKYLTS